MAPAPRAVGGGRPLRLDGDDRLPVAPVPAGHRVPGSVRPGHRPARCRIGALVADQTVLDARSRPGAVRGRDPARSARARQTGRGIEGIEPAIRPGQGTPATRDSQRRPCDDRLRARSGSGLVRTPGICRERPPASAPRQQRAAVRAGGSHPEHCLHTRGLRPVYVRSPVVPAASLNARSPRTPIENPASVDEEAQQVGPGKDPNRFAVVDDQERILGLQDVTSG